MTDTTENLGFFKKSANAGIPYFHIFDHSICQKSKTAAEGWEGPIETEHPQTKAKVHTWIMRYDSIAAYIADAEWFTKEFTKEQGGGRTAGIDLTLQAGKMRARLTLKWGANGPDQVLKRFLKIAPNADWDKPLLISAFENREGKQAVSFRQGDDPDPQKWTKVDEYWRRPLGPDKKPDFSFPATGADGSIMPEPEQDEFTQKWDYSAQNKFLMRHFMTVTLPKLKAIAEAKGFKSDPAPAGADADVDDDGFPAYSGQTPVEEIPVVTTKPDNVVAASMAEMATGAQRAQIRAMSTQANFDFESKCQEVLGCPFDNLNKLGASFAIYKLGQMIAKQGSPAPAPQAMTEMAVAAPAPAVTLPASIPPTAPPAAPPVLGDDWGTASAPSEAAAPTGAEKAPWDD